MKNSENANPGRVEPEAVSGRKGRKMSTSSNIVDRIRRTLKEVAKKEDTITYRALASNIGKLDVQHWPELDVLSQEEKRDGRPDLTLVVVNADTKFPGKFNGRRMDAEDWWTKEKTRDLYCKRRDEVYEYYRAAK